MKPAADAVPFFDIASPDFSIKSDEVYRAREHSWYARTSYGLAILRHDQVSRLLNHPRLRQGSIAWPAHNGVTGGSFVRWFESWVLNKEGADHRRLRRLLNPAFSPRLVTPLAPRFRALAHELIDGFAEAGRCEFVSEFASPYAARAIAIVLGIPESEWPVIARESATVGLAMGIRIGPELPRIERALDGLFAYADELIAQCRNNNMGRNNTGTGERDDILGTLVRVSREAGELSEEELRDSLVLLIFGGFDTTRSQLGLAIQTFLRHPGQWRLLAERPELGRAAVDEVMRVNPTVTWVTREALEDFTFDGLDIPAGTTLHLFSQSAGTDPMAFPEAGFDITAERRPHFGFGGGAHYCLGHFVARTDMSEALTVLARRLPGLSPGGQQAWLPDSGNTGPVSLPLSFTS
jgi:cytochrome P450